MREPEIKNAIIESTHLGKEDHGIPTCYLRLNYGGSGQAFGGHDLRWGPYGMEYITRVLDTLGVAKWEDLPGKHIRVKAAFPKVHAIGHIIEDKWFNPEHDLTEAQPL